MGNLRAVGLATLSICLALGVTACGEEDGGRKPGGPGAGAGDGDDGSGTGGTGGTGGDDGAGDDGSGTGGGGDGGDGGDDDGGDDGDPVPKFDLGIIPDSGAPPEEEGCQKVDLLFVIDNSGSMFDNQQNLTNSFPGFADTMLNTLDADDFHVGVTTSDAYTYNQPGCTQIGSLVTQTSAQVCTPYADGQRYMTQNDDLATKFACAGLPGDTGNGDEHQMEAATLALGNALNAPGACNEGFIRPDALLVLVVITDEDDSGDGLLTTGSPGDPNSWFNTVVGIKGNIEENVVTLALLWGMPGNVCPPPQSSERVGTRIQQFTDLFTYGFVGDSCAADYTPFLVDAVSVIDSACAGFTPPG